MAYFKWTDTFADMVWLVFIKFSPAGFCTQTKHWKVTGQLDEWCFLTSLTGQFFLSHWRVKYSIYFDRVLLTLIEHMWPLLVAYRANSDLELDLRYVSEDETLPPPSLPADGCWLSKPFWKNSPSVYIGQWRAQRTTESHCWVSGRPGFGGTLCDIPERDQTHSQSRLSAAVWPVFDSQVVLCRLAKSKLNVWVKRRRMKHKSTLKSGL